MNVYTLENQVVISALLVKTDYSADNSTLENKINPNFYLRRQLSIAPIAFDESYIVRGKDGRALFSVLKNLPHKDIGTGVILRWIASVLILLSLFSHAFLFTSISTISVRVKPSIDDITQPNDYS